MAALFAAFMIICGTAVGAVQFFILKNITERILITNKSPLYPIILKAAVYAVSAVLLLTVLRGQIFFIGIGFGGGITISTLIYFVIIRCRSKDHIGKEDK